MTVPDRALRVALHLAFAAGLLWPAAGQAEHDDVPVPPPTQTDETLPQRLNFDPRSVTVSGISSGGFFAHQFHVAYSATVAGAGIMAGGPYGCVETVSNPYWPFKRLDRMSAALVACTNYWGDRYWGLRPSPPSSADSIELVDEARRRGVIDDPGNLSDDRVWLFLGEDDSIVPDAVVSALEELYRHFGSEEQTLAVVRRSTGHGVPVRQSPEQSEFPPRSCGEEKPPFIIQCGFDAAGLLLQHLYADGFSAEPTEAHQAGTLIPFDQTRFSDQADSTVALSGVGYLYLPTSCRLEACRLHVVFHGCQQNVHQVHDDFIRDAGYNGWAAANRVVIVYPQTAVTAANPNGCWDFWGYSDPEYRMQDGKQMRAVKAIVDDLLAGER